MRATLFHPFAASLRRCVRSLLVLILFSDFASAQPTYPSAPRTDHTDILHGTEVPDPYRWLESIDSPETRTWIAAQGKLFDSWIADAPKREWMRARLEILWHYDKYGLPRQAGDRIFYTRKSGLQNQGLLYWHAAGDDSNPIVLLDPNALSEDGTVALSDYSVSDDGKHVAYSLSEAGSDWITWRIREVATGKDLPEVIKWSKFTGAEWSRDSKGFYYSAFDAPEKGKELEAVNYYKKLYYHTLNTPQSEDRLIYERTDQKEWAFHAITTEDKRYLLLHVTNAASSDNALFYLDLEKPDAQVIELITGFEASWSFLGNDGSVFYFHTTAAAANGRIVSINIEEDPDPANPHEIVAESRDNNLEDVSLFGDTFICTYQVDVINRTFLHDLEGKRLGEIAYPVPASIGGYHGRRTDKETFYSVVGNTTPHRIYRYDIESNASTLFREPEIDFDPDDFVSRQVFYESKDGTRVPMFLSHRKDTPMDGTAPAYLYGYGGFNISLGPYFSVSTVLWMEMGGVAATANLRGGGEYGEAWHEAGWRDKKQNVFDDFIAAAEYLIAEKITSREKLAGGGGSNGGLLVAACINQRPDLFGAAIADVGVHDMLRFQKFTIGWAWMDEFGNPDNPGDFKNLFAYSPYHNTQTRHPYPATLIMTADHDDRVFPAHSFKQGAALQHAQSGHKGDDVPPVLMRIETRAGHGAGTPTSKQIEEAVDRWSFLSKVFDLEKASGLQ